MSEDDDRPLTAQADERDGSPRDADWHTFRPHEGHGLRHDPMTAIVAPRPIGWISTTSSAGRINLAPYSFFNMFRPRPALLGFCSGGEKDSLANARATGHFVWNLASRDLAQAMVATSASVDHGIDEFALAGLTPAPSSLPGVPYVAEAPVSLDCVVTQIIPLNDRHSEASGTTLVVGEVVMARIARRVIRDGVFSTILASPVTRAGGTGHYFGLSEETFFEIERPD